MFVSSAQIIKNVKPKNILRYEPIALLCKNIYDIDITAIRKCDIDIYSHLFLKNCSEEFMVNLMAIKPTRIKYVGVYGCIISNEIDINIGNWKLINYKEINNFTFVPINKQMFKGVIK